MGEKGDENASDAARLKAKSDALRLLSARPRSSAELTLRLKAKRHDPEIIRQVIGLLSAQGMVDDAKFAKLYAESKRYGRPVSKSRLLGELARLGIDGDTASSAVESTGDLDERKAARELVAKRFDRMKGLPAARKKSRLYAFLRRRGYSNDVIFEVLDELFGAEEKGGE